MPKEIDGLENIIKVEFGKKIPDWFPKVRADATAIAKRCSGQTWEEVGAVFWELQRYFDKINEENAQAAGASYDPDAAYSQTIQAGEDLGGNFDLATPAGKVSISIEGQGKGGRQWGPMYKLDLVNMDRDIAEPLTQYVLNRWKDIEPKK